MNTTRTAFAALAALATALAGCPTEVGNAGVVAVAITPASPTSSDELVANALDDQGLTTDLAGATLSWSLDGVAAGATGPTLGSAATTRGQQWRVAVTVGSATVESEPVTIGNSPPSITEVQLSPAEPGSDETIEVLVAGWVDADDDPRSYLFEWMVEGQILEGESESTLQPGAYARDDALSVRVTPDDGFEFGAPLTSSSVTVGNGAPFAPTVAITPAEPSPGQDDLVCVVDTSSAADPDGDSCTYDVRWILDGAAFPDPANPGGPEPTTTTLAGDTIPANETEVDQNWTCRVVANDGTGDGPPGEASVYLAAGPVNDFSLEDVNATSPTVGLAVSPRDYLQKTSGWYFGHAT
ncbi:MAG: hypothetical protein KDA24_10730 [Deltaproteobacteria bacterium]|nr:hypothetical protein [Deltaproteobacteria bacterium]